MFKKQAEMEALKEARRIKRREQKERGKKDDNESNTHPVEAPSEESQHLDKLEVPAKRPRTSSAVSDVTPSPRAQASGKPPKRPTEKPTVEAIIEKNNTKLKKSVLQKLKEPAQEVKEFKSPLQAKSKAVEKDLKKSKIYQAGQEYG